MLNDLEEEASTHSFKSTEADDEIYSVDEEVKDLESEDLDCE